MQEDEFFVEMGIDIFNLKLLIKCRIDFHRGHEIGVFFTLGEDLVEVEEGDFSVLVVLRGAFLGEAFGCDYVCCGVGGCPC